MDRLEFQKQLVRELGTLYEPGEAENIARLVMETILHKKSIAPEEADVLTEQLVQIKNRLLAAEPVQYILKEAWFYDIPFYVNSNVLIPRPETEELVDWIIKENKQKRNLTILDVGTGSGCIPIILKRKLEAVTIYSCDISEAAIEVARQNAITHSTNITFLTIDVLDNAMWKKLPDADIIVSNPPYIPEQDKNMMHKNVLAYEPHSALFVADNDPLVFYKAMAELGKKNLKSDGKIYVEIPESLGADAMTLFENFNYKTTLKKDMQGKDRMLKAITK